MSDTEGCPPSDKEAKGLAKRLRKMASQKIMRKMAMLSSTEKKDAKRVFRKGRRSMLQADKNGHPSTSWFFQLEASSRDFSSQFLGDNNQSIPEGDGPEGTDTAQDKSKLDNSTHKSHYTLLDWRDFRANLVARQQVKLLDLGAPIQGHEPSPRLGLKWAHPIRTPEIGCVLVATEKLDGVRSFERTVVLLLRLGARDPREGPFGIIINRPLHKKIKHMKLSNPDLATTFADCPLHFGGPLDASMFLLKAGENSPISIFEQVVPGLCFGARNNLDEAAGLVKKGVLKPQDFRFFVGYAGWQLDQLREEIELDYWVVAACSSSLLGGASADASSGLWEEILQLMGGQYSELSRKPRLDSS